LTSSVSPVVARNFPNASAICLSVARSASDQARLAVSASIDRGQPLEILADLRVEGGDGLGLDPGPLPDQALVDPGVQGGDPPLQVGGEGQGRHALVLDPGEGLAAGQTCPETPGGHDQETQDGERGRQGDLRPDRGISRKAHPALLAEV
jgi:hypothetical protein